MLAENSDDTIPDPDKRITFIAGLPRDSQGLAAAARRASTPGRPGYRQFLTLKKAAATYGATPDHVQSLRSVAQPLGISVDIDASGVFATLTASARTWEGVFDDSILYIPPQGTASSVYVFGDLSSGLFLGVPKILAPHVTALVPTYSEYAPVDIPPTRSTAGSMPRNLWPIDDSVPWPANDGTPYGPTCDQRAIEAKALFTPLQTRTAYGITALDDRAAQANAEVAIISLGGPYVPADLQAYTDCFGLPKPRIRERQGLGVTFPFSQWDRFVGDPTEVEDTVETHLDLMTVLGALGEGAAVTLIEETNNPTFTGLVDGLARALNANGRGTRSPDAVSVSYGDCENSFSVDQQQGVTGMPTVPLIEDLLAMSAVVGTSAFVSSGDLGSASCQSQLPYRDQVRSSVIYPASSPWATSVGGTRLTLGAGNKRLNETVWNDSLFGQVAAGTGGPSALFDPPWYQVTTASRGPRAVPDLSALAALRPGWPVFLGGTVEPVGGTSGSSPFLAATFAILSARERLAGRPPLGFLNPWLYSLPAKALYDVTEGSNQLALPVGDGQFNAPPCCQAHPGYHTATGLGTPKVVRMAQSITPAVPRR